MKLKYLEDTDTFYMILSDKSSIESAEISDGLIADFDIQGNLVGFEILSAKSKIDFNDLFLESLPLTSIRFANEEIDV
ncbi:MAG: DUF2283 domain-containing protein [Candidatus Kapabacteria bacterium]|nr:DUF2283 domain-containing protein [Ignavibacteriota bacterium]MCW5885403.1 DUF2283 domain-containing protein [Candidatus Kapabacteria bacterium]